MDDMQDKFNILENKLNIVLKTLKDISRYIKAQYDCELNRSLSVDRKLDNINKTMENIKQDQDRLEKIESILYTDKYIRNYNGQEIYIMHKIKKMSWDKISQKTGLSVSTLRAREKTYRDALLKNMIPEDEEVII